MKQYEMMELSFPCNPPETNWADVRPVAVFTHNGKETKIEGFYAGNGQCKVRFLPMEAGHYDWKMGDKTGSFDAEPATAHGPVHADGTAFRYADGTLFHPFGTTVYALISQDDALIETTMQTLEKSPFNKIRMCVFPKHYDFNHNEPTYYAFEKAEDGSWDPSRPVFAFWDTLDKHLTRLNGMGIQVDLILFHPYDRWGFDGMGAEKDKTYLDYLLRRLAAYPHIWWSLANEYELCKRTEQDWFNIEQFVAEHDPFHHLLSCHNIFKIWDARRPLTTHSSIQSKSFYLLKEWLDKTQKPVMLDECCYEGNLEHFWGCITGKEMTARFWRTVSTGAYCTHGETFYADDDILWWARGGKLKGESPQRIAFCREIIEALPGHLEGEPSFMTRLLPLMSMTEEQRETALRSADEKGAGFIIRAFLNAGEYARDFAFAEIAWYGHIGDDVFLHYYDIRPIARETLRLPEGKTYRIEMIDTWNMTRETIATGVSGNYVVELPSREYMAILATAEKQ